MKSYYYLVLCFFKIIVHGVKVCEMDFLLFTDLKHLHFYFLTLTVHLVLCFSYRLVLFYFALRIFCFESCCYLNSRTFTYEFLILLPSF